MITVRCVLLQIMNASNLFSVKANYHLLLSCAMSAESGDPLEVLAKEVLRQGSLRSMFEAHSWIFLSCMLISGKWKSVD